MAYGSLSGQSIDLSPVYDKLNSKLSLSGGTITGPILYNQPPQSSNELVTYQYVQSNKLGIITTYNPNTKQWSNLKQQTVLNKTYVFNNITSTNIINNLLLESDVFSIPNDGTDKYILIKQNIFANNNQINMTDGLTNFNNITITGKPNNINNMYVSNLYCTVQQFSGGYSNGQVGLCYYNITINTNTINLSSIQLTINNNQLLNSSVHIEISILTP